MSYNLLNINIYTAQGNNNMKRNYAIGARIKVAMKTAGYKTAKAFCEQHKIPYLTFAQHIQGRRHPTQSSLDRYSKLFGVSKHWLKTGEGNPLNNGDNSDNLIQLTSDEIDKRLQIDELTKTSLDTTLLSEILKEILIQGYNMKAKEANAVSKATTYIYNDIVNREESHETQQKLIAIAVKTFLQMRLS